VRKSSAFLVLPLIALAAAGCGSSSKKKSTTSAPAVTKSTATTSPSTGATKVSSATIAGLGTVLVNAQGKTLYTFEPDKAKKVTCTGGCAATFPPLILSGTKAVAAGAVKASLLSADPNPSGGKVVTYAGWPLYTYVADSYPGLVAGQADSFGGGLWYVISPSGAVIKK